LLNKIRHFSGLRRWDRPVLGEYGYVDVDTW
jgi:hypothetical protein